MSFASAFKRIFGLDSDDYSENIDTTAEDADVQVHTGADSGSDEPDDTPVPTVSAEMKAKIYEGAVAIFNQALPDFLSRSVDPQAQQRLLAESIDKSVDQYLDNLMKQAEQYAEAKLRAFGRGIETRCRAAPCRDAATRTATHINPRTAAQCRPSAPRNGRPCHRPRRPGRAPRGRARTIRT